MLAKFGTKYANIAFYLNCLNHILIACVAIYMTNLCRSLNFEGTALHAFLCTIGYQLLMVEGVMVYYPGNVLTKKLSRKTQTRLHVAFQAIGGGLGIIGALLKIYSTEFHFTTLHGKVGLAAGLLSTWAMLNGLATLYSHKIHHMSPMKIKTIHNAVGLSACIAGLCAVFLGYGTQFTEKYVDNSTANILSLVTVIVLALSAYWPLVTLRRRIKVIFKL